AARALRRLGARKVKTTEVPVIFDPDTAASLLRSVAGAASGPSLYRRASFLLERLGTRVGAPAVTIVDAGLLPGGLGSRPSRGAAGGWLEDGRLAFPVEEVTVTGTLLEMFDRIEGIGNDLVLPDRVSAPTLKIARMVVAGD